MLSHTPLRLIVAWLLRLSWHINTSKKLIKACSKLLVPSISSLNIFYLQVCFQNVLNCDKQNWQQVPFMFFYSIFSQWLLCRRQKRSITYLVYSEISHSLVLWRESPVLLHQCHTFMRQMYNAFIHRAGFQWNKMVLTFATVPHSSKTIRIISFIMTWLIRQLLQHFVNTEQENNGCIQWLMLSGNITYINTWICLVYILHHNEYVTMRLYWLMRFVLSSLHPGALMCFKLVFLFTFDNIRHLNTWMPYKYI